MTHEQMLLETAKVNLPVANKDSLDYIQVPIPHNQYGTYDILRCSSSDSAIFHSLEFKKVKIGYYEIDTNRCIYMGYKYILNKK